MSTTERTEIKQGLIIFILYAVMMFIPFIGFLTYFLLPLPMIYFVYKFRLKAAIILGAIILMLQLLIAQPAAIYFSMIGIIVGITMGALYKKTVGTTNSYYPYIGGVIAHIATHLIFFILMKVAFGIDFNQLIQQEISSFERALVAEEGFFQLPLDAEQLTANIRFFPMIIPSFIIIMSAVFAAFHHLLARVLLKYFGVQLERLPKLREWQFPRAFIYWYLLSLFLLLIGMMDEGGMLYPIVVNVQSVLEIIMYLQGLAVIAYYSHLKKKGFLLPAITIGLTILFPLFVMLFVRILGILELGFGLRARMRPSE